MEEKRKREEEETVQEKRREKLTGWTDLRDSVPDLVAELEIRANLHQNRREIGEFTQQIVINPIRIRFSFGYWVLLVGNR